MYKRDVNSDFLKRYLFDVYVLIQYTNNSKIFLTVTTLKMVNATEPRRKYK